MSILQLAELQAIVSDFKRLKDFHDGVASLEGQARAIADALYTSDVFQENASDEEKQLVSKYLSTGA